LPAPGPEQSANHLAESVAAIAHRQQLKFITGPHFPPSARDGMGGFPGRQRAFELVRRY
jgi:hypothetical protein